MPLYVKEVSNQKQEIDRQHHTIPNQKTSIVGKSKGLDFTHNADYYGILLIHTYF